MIEKNVERKKDEKFKNHQKVNQRRALWVNKLMIYSEMNSRKYINAKMTMDIFIY